MEETKEYVSQKTIEIIELGIKQELDGSVKQLIFKCKDGFRITYAPKYFQEEISEYNGLKTTKQVLKRISLDQLPKKFLEINHQIKQLGVCKIIGSYHIWKRELNGNIEAFNFFLKPQFDELKIIDN